MKEAVTRRVVSDEAGKPERHGPGLFRMTVAVVGCLLCVLYGSIFPALAREVPPLKGYVNDYGNMISPGVRSTIEEKLRAFEKTDSTQVVILTIPSLDGDVLEEFSIKVAEAWKMGQKGKDNGVILLVSDKDRKIRIEVGRGLEGKLTDLVSGRITREAIRPRFVKGDYDGGFVAATDAIIAAIRGEFKADKGAVRGPKKSSFPLPLLLIAGMIGLFFLGKMSRVLGGAAGAIGLPVLAYFLGLSLITIILLGILGLLAGIFLPLLMGGFRGGDGFWPGGFGGFGGFGGGSDSGGSDDFGGGGGGDFGGGGSSDDY